jgi:hypothetical protein
MTNASDNNQSPDSDDRLTGPAKRQASDDDHGCNAGTLDASDNQ